MRFHRFGKYEFRDTERKRAAFARKQKAEREALPLFADQVAAEQIDVDEERGLLVFSAISDGTKS